MPPNAKRRPLAKGGISNIDRLDERIRIHNSHRNARRQYLVRHLHAAGPRPVLEALLEAAAGHDIDRVLERFASIPVHIYRQLGVDYFDSTLAVIDGGRA